MPSQKAADYFHRLEELNVANALYSEEELAEFRRGYGTMPGEKAPMSLKMGSVVFGPEVTGSIDDDGIISFYQAGSWIPVTPETMPKEREFVLVYLSAGVDSRKEVARFYEHHWRHYTFSPLDDKYDNRNVTHWQPLPADPPQAKP